MIPVSFLCGSNSNQSKAVQFQKHHHYLNYLIYAAFQVFSKLQIVIYQWVMRSDEWFATNQMLFHMKENRVENIQRSSNIVRVSIVS